MHDPAPRRPRLTALLLTGLLGLAGAAPDGVDLLVADNPRAFRILNKYEQELPFQERQGFTPHLPLEVVDESALLSDGFTSCMIVRVGRERYYLLKRDDGELMEADRGGTTAIYRDATAVDDSVSILREGVLAFRARPDGDARPGAEPAAGAVFARRYTWRDWSYLERPDAAIRQGGWVRLTERARGRDWEPLEHRETDGLPGRVVDAVAGEVATANRLFAALADRFGGPAPAWEWTLTDGMLRCTLRHDGDTAAFAASRQQFLLTLRRRVAASALEVVETGEAIVVRPAAGGTR